MNPRMNEFQRQSDNRSPLLLNSITQSQKKSQILKISQKQYIEQRKFQPTNSQNNYKWNYYEEYSNYSSPIALQYNQIIINQSQKKYMMIELQKKSNQRLMKPQEPQNKPMIPKNVISPNDNKKQLPYDIQQQMKKLMLAYTDGKSQRQLNKNQFIQLVNDLYQGLDKERKLNSSQLDSIMIMVDDNKDGTISKQQLVRIAKNNELKK